MILTGQMNRKGGAYFHPGFITQFDSFELPILDNPFTPGTSHDARRLRPDRRLALRGTAW